MNGISPQELKMPCHVTYTKHPFELIVSVSYGKEDAQLLKCPLLVVIINSLIPYQYTL